MKLLCNKHRNIASRVGGKKEVLMRTMAMEESLVKFGVASEVVRNSSSPVEVGAD